MQRLQAGAVPANKQTPDFRTDPKADYLQGVQSVRKALENLLDATPEDQPVLRQMFGALHATFKRLLLPEIAPEEIVKSLQSTVGMPMMPGIPQVQQAPQPGQQPQPAVGQAPVTQGGQPPMSLGA